MKNQKNLMMTGAALMVLCFCLALTPNAQAQVGGEADLSSTVTLPEMISLGTPFNVEVGYANAGPATASGVYPNGEFIPPMGLDVFLDNYWNGDKSIYDNLRDSAVDSRGNTPLLFWDDFYCETVSFQVQGEQTGEGAVPIAPIAAGESGTFTFETAFPMDSPRGGNVEITAPESLAKVWTLTDPSNFFIGKGYATTYSGFATTTCEQLVGDPEEDVCGYIDDNCWGTKVSHLPEPLALEFVLVDDGTATPTYGCAPFTNDVAGKIAVLERGSCEFGDKGFNAEQAGAAGVFMVNSNLCSPPDFPDSDQCVINMGSGALGALVTIPIVMVSQADGTPVLDALVGGETVTGVFGGSSTFSAQGWTYHGGDSGDTDSNDENDVAVVKTSVSAGPPPVTGTTYFVPAAALAAGAAGSFYQTDVDINNAGDADVTYTFQWLPRGADNSDPVASSEFTLAAGASMRYANVLSGVFGLSPDVSGGIAVMASADTLKVMTRTYNVADEGTFGQAIPGIPAADLLAQGDTHRINFMSQGDALRANLGCVNGTDANVAIAINLYGADGTMLETKGMNLSAYSNNQINKIFKNYAPVNGYVDVMSNTADAAYFCYGSVLDNATSDPTTILPAEYGMSSTYYVPAAALAAGAAGSFYQTDVDVNNAGAAMATYQFAWLPRGVDNSMPTMSAEYTLAAGASVRYENALSEVFGLAPDVAGAVSVMSDSPDMGITTRTYNVADEGTFGQAVPGIPADMLLGEGDMGRIIFLSQDDALRANVGCVNGTAANVAISIRLYDADGTMLTTKGMNLSAYSNNQINKIFKDYAPVNGYVDVMSSTAGAAYFCYGSVLDNATSDPTTILPQ